MSGKASSGTRILGSLRSAEGVGVVRIEDRYDTDIDDLWSAITDPDRLARPLLGTRRLWQGPPNAVSGTRPFRPCDARAVA
jgi:hypothetical protein